MAVSRGEQLTVLLEDLLARACQIKSAIFGVTHGNFMNVARGFHFHFE